MDPADRADREVEASYRTLLETTSELVALLDPGGDIASLNPAGEAMLRVPREELVGTSWADLIAPAGRPLVDEHLAAARSGERSPAIRVDALAGDGTRVPLELSVAPVLVEGTVWQIQVLARVLQPDRPISELVAAAESRFQALVEQLPVITYVAPVDDLEKTTYVGRRIDLLGCTPEEWVAAPDSFVKHLHPDDRERVLATIRAAIEAGLPYVDEYRMVARDGRVVWMRDHGMVLEDEQGQRFLVGLILDVTERRLLEEARADREGLAKEILGQLEARGLPSGTWLVDIEQTRRSLHDADSLLRRLADAIVRSAPPPSGA